MRLAGSIVLKGILSQILGRDEGQESSPPRAMSYLPKGSVFHGEKAQKGVEGKSSPEKKLPRPEATMMMVSHLQQEGTKSQEVQVLHLKWILQCIMSVMERLLYQKSSAV